MVRMIQIGGRKVRVSGSMQALNDICAGFYAAYNYEREHNYNALAELYGDCADALHDELEKRGFYDDVRKEETA